MSKESFKLPITKERKSNVISIKDPITGLMIKSDKLYKPKSELAKGWQKFFDPAPKVSMKFEFEKDQIVVTLDSKAETNRFVLDGDFKYSKRGNISGKLARFTQGDFFEDDADEYITVYNARNKSFSNTIGIEKVVASTAPSRSNRIFTYRDKPDSVASSLGFPVDTDKGRLGSLGLNPFFKGNWWINPFDSNLI
jgi:hypothetical protein